MTDALQIDPARLRADGYRPLRQASSPYLLTGQVLIGGSATLTIEAGVTVYGYKDDGSGSAPGPALVIDGSHLCSGLEFWNITCNFVMVRQVLSARPACDGRLIDQ